MSRPSLHAVKGYLNLPLKYNNIDVRWNARIVELNFIKDRLSHLENVIVGDTLRLLDFILQGTSTRLIAKYTDFSEVFILK